MEIQQVVTDLASEGNFKSSDYKIELNATAYAVLSKNLYSDIYAAIVRELCCNAWDSHVAAGTTETQFELYLPNTLAPIFKVRDFGTGLSPEEMTQVYLSFFTSSKQSDNRQTGCFGLGCKTPWGYTQMFTAVSYYNGVRYHYVSNIGTQGKPQLVLMAENPTTEPNGMEISFAVQPQHFSLFVVAARRVLRAFKNQPAVKGFGGFKVDTYGDLLISGDGWAVHEKGGGSCEGIVTMGNVAYPLGSDTTGFTSLAKIISQLKIVCDFPLGSFEMTPSRESLHKTEHTTKNISDRFEIVYEEILDLIVSKIAAAETEWDACLIFRKLVVETQLSILNTRNPFQWNGIPLKTHKNITDNIKIDAFESIERNRKQACTRSQRKSVYVDAGITFYLDDHPRASYRLANFVRENPSNEAHYLVSVLPKLEEKVAILPFTEEEKPSVEVVALPPVEETKPVDPRTWDDIQLDAFCVEMGFPRQRLTLVSTLPQKVRVRTPRNPNSNVRRSTLSGTKSRAFLFDADARSGQNSDTLWSETEVDLTKPGLYLKIERWQPNDGKVKTLDDLSSAVRCAVKVGFWAKDMPIIGVKAAHLEKFEAKIKAAGSPLQLFAPTFQKNLEDLWASDKDLQRAKLYLESWVHSNDRGIMNAFRTFVKRVKEDSKELKVGFKPNAPLLAFVEATDVMYAKQEILSYINQHIHMTPDASASSDSENFDFMRTVENRYPLIAWLHARGTRWELQDLIVADLLEYTEMRDLKLEMTKESETVKEST